MVERCRAGRFSQLEVNRGLPAPLLMRYFSRHGLDWQIDDSIRRMVEVRQANLAAPSAVPEMGGIDLVMIRNVLIYFDDATKASILDSVLPRMRPDGYLMLGSSEVSTGAAVGFDRQQAGRTIFFRPRALKPAR
jgi:chemotaxis protein methyltransferase CheR